MAFAHVQDSTATFAPGPAGTQTNLINGAAAGNLVVVTIASSGVALSTLTDSASNSYTVIDQVVHSGGFVLSVWYSVVGTGGNLLITGTFTGNTNEGAAMAANEYSFPVHASISIDSHVNANGTSTAPATGNITPAASDLLFGTLSKLGFAIPESITPGGGTNVRQSLAAGASENYPGLLIQDLLNNSTSPTVFSGTMTSDPWDAIGVAFTATPTSILPSPLAVPTNHAAGTTIALTGTSTSWVSGTTVFALSGVLGVALVGSPIITSPTAATIVVTTGATTGNVTVSDGTLTGYFTVSSASLSVAPPGVGANTATTITATGTNTIWLSEPGSPPLFSAAGVSGAVVSGIAITNDTAATLTLTTGAATGTATLTDTSTASTSTIGVFASPPGIASSPTFVPANLTGFTLALTGTDTTWTPGTPGSPTLSISGVTGVSKVSQHIISATSATLVITTGTTTGTLTISDGSYSGTVAIVHAAVVSNTYVGRSGQAYFFTSDTVGVPTLGGLLAPVTAVNSNPTISVNGNSITLATGASTATSFGPLWSNTTHNCPFVAYQMLCGSVASVVVQAGGSAYTSPVATPTGGGGTGLVLGTPTLLNGVIAAIAVGTPGTGYTHGDSVRVIDSTGAGSGFVGHSTVSGGAVASIVVENGGSNYSTGHLTANFSTDNSNPSNGDVVLTAPTIGNGGIVNGVIGTVPVISPGLNYTSAPTIAITGGGTGAVAVPIMSGPASTDVVTYSASANWLATAAGGVGAASSAPMLNYAGQIEPAFNAPRTMRLGMNVVGPQGYGGAYAKNQNWLNQIQANWHGANPPAVTISDSTGILATAVGIVNSSGVVTGYTVTCGGVGYTAPTGLVAAPPSGVTAIVGSITLSGGVITGIAPGSTSGSGYAGSTIDGRPIAINSAVNAANASTSGKPTAFGCFADASHGQANAIDTQGLPDQSGTWTFVADEANPASPMVVSVYVAGTTTFVSGTITHGPIVAGVEIGKKWTFSVVRTSNKWELQLWLNLSGPTSAASAPWTLSNEFLTAPVRGSGASVVPDRAHPMAPDINLVNWLSTPNGHSLLRIFPFGPFAWGNNVVDASDLRSATDFTWGDGAQRNTNIVVTAIRAYRIWGGSSGWFSPYIWTNQAYPGTFPTSGLTSGQISSAWGATTPPLYYWVPPGNVSVNNVDWMTQGGNIQSVAAEFTTAAPHGRKTGQQFTIPDNSLTRAVPTLDANNGGAPVTAEFHNYTPTVYVTGESSFAILFPGTTHVTLGPHCSNVSGSNVANFTSTFPFPPNGVNGGFALPYEAVAAIVAAIPGCDLHTFVPTFGTDACYTQIAQTLLAGLPAGRKLYLQYVNEHWNSYSADFNNMYIMASLLSTGTAGVRIQNSADFYTWGASHAHSVFFSIFNAAGRGADLVRIFGGQWQNTTIASAIIGFANLYNGSSPAPAVPIRIDGMMIAPYMGIANDTMISAAAASTYSNYPGSIKSRCTTPWTMGMFLDFYRHYLLYVTSTLMANDLAVNSTFNLALAGQTAVPFLMGYEASVAGGCPGLVSTTNWLMRAFISHDMFFHSNFTDVNAGYYAGLQAGGLVAANVYVVCQARFAEGSSATIQGNDDSAGDVLWGCATWEGMAAGRGDGSLDGSGNATVNLSFNATGQPQDLNNVSPKMQSWRDWVAAVPAAAVRSAKRWFPGLSSRTTRRRRRR